MRRRDAAKDRKEMVAMAAGDEQGMVPLAYAELAELAGGFIHEIKNHLSTLGLNLQLLAEDFEHPETQRERRALERIQRLQGECGQLVEVSNDFLRFARVQTLDLTPADLSEVVEEILDFFSPTARQAHIKINSYVPSDLPSVRLDRDMFKQALLNIMLNAEQAMPQGGELTIQASAQGDQVVLNLIDTGKGISADHLAKIFRPFFSTKPGGTGLGLPTTKKIVAAHGGQVRVQSDVGRGTQFSILLPAYANPPQEKK
jgi:two-component system, NtrC family, sensor histidine kinase HydH